MRKLTLSVILFLLAVSTYGQEAEKNEKIGHVRINYVLASLPEYKVIETELREYELQLTNQLEAKIMEFEKKLKLYEQLDDSIKIADKNKWERELSDLQTDIQKFEKEAKVAYLVKQEKLIKPLEEKIMSAIEEIALENKLSYVLNVNDNLLFYKIENDFSESVISKLAIN